ncbi:MAG TPA: mechanosensitive ion channel family protein [Solirubrobacteraceae bacterium]|jgi:small-conductance mechanosensitive channel|nr:mechanosensitive ion channel family protein [Solirubrobacteraceae bacterium]
MPRIFQKRKDLALDRMFETRSEAWAAVGLNVEINRHAVRRSARRLPVELAALIAVVLGENWARDHIHDLYVRSKNHPHAPAHHWIVGKGPVTVAAVLLVLALGWLISRDLAKVVPALSRRMDPATAGTVEFLIRFITVAATVLGALAVGGIALKVLAVGGAFTAVVLGLAAQQTLGNLFAGMVLLSARPFRLGERVRLQAGVLAGSMEGVVSSLGLLYTTLSRGEERVMIPNNVVLSAAVLPLREPNPVDVRVTLNSGISLTHMQSILDTNISVPTRKAPNVLLEEINGDSVVVRVQATPDRHSDGARLADEIISALLSVTGQHRATADAGAPRS